jgi:hypothetical protein
VQGVRAREVRERVRRRDLKCVACERVGVYERVRVRGRLCGSSSESIASVSVSESVHARFANACKGHERERVRERACVVSSESEARKRACKGEIVHALAAMSATDVRVRGCLCKSVCVARTRVVTRATNSHGFGHGPR